MILIYDNGGVSFDRYTAFDNNDYSLSNGTKYYRGVGFSDNPFHPQGFGQHIEVSKGAHLGNRIALKNLPIKAQIFIREVF